MRRPSHWLTASITTTARALQGATFPSMSAAPEPVAIVFVRIATSVTTRDVEFLPERFVPRRSVAINPFLRDPRWDRRHFPPRAMNLPTPHRRCPASSVIRRPEEIATNRRVTLPTMLPPDRTVEQPWGSVGRASPRTNSSFCVSLENWATLSAFLR